MEKITVHWKIPGFEYARVGEIKTVKIFGVVVYASIGSSIAVFGWVVN